MLPQPILDELWNVEHRVSDVVIDYLCEEFLAKGFRLQSTEDLEFAIYAIFSFRSLVCELRVDRLARTFTLTAAGPTCAWIPVTGGWELIEAAITTLVGQKQFVAS